VLHGSNDNIEMSCLIRSNLSSLLDAGISNRLNLHVVSSDCIILLCDLGKNKFSKSL